MREREREREREKREREREREREKREWLGLCLEMLSLQMVNRALLKNSKLKTWEKVVIQSISCIILVSLMFLMVRLNLWNKLDKDVSQWHSSKRDGGTCIIFSITIERERERDRQRER